MPIETQRAWLTEETDGHARIELAELLLRRPTGSFVECSDEKQCTRKIHRLQELLGDAIVGYEPPDDGIAEPMASTVRYNAEELTARFLMVDREEVAEDDLPVCSPQSPLGTALNGAKAGDRRKFSVRGGNVVIVTLVMPSPIVAPTIRARHDELPSVVAARAASVGPTGVRRRPRISDPRPRMGTASVRDPTSLPSLHGPVADPFQETCRAQ